MTDCLLEHVSMWIPFHVIISWLGELASLISSAEWATITSSDFSHASLDGFVRFFNSCVGAMYEGELKFWNVRYSSNKISGSQTSFVLSDRLLIMSYVP